MGDWKKVVHGFMHFNSTFGLFTLNSKIKLKNETVKKYLCCTELLLVTGGI